MNTFYNKFHETNTTNCFFNLYYLTHLNDESGYSFYSKIEFNNFLKFLNADGIESSPFHDKIYTENLSSSDLKNDFPESYPFDALQWKNEEIPDWTNEAFWSAYQHSPLPSN